MRLLLPAATALALTAASIISFARGAELRVGDLAITSAWARATPPGASTAGAYVTVENHGRTADRLLGVTTPAAGMVMAHETHEENGVASMRMVDAPELPAGGSLAMQPGGLHLMLMQLHGPLKAGDDLPLTLTFEHAGPVTLRAAVAPLGANNPPAAQ